MGLLQDLLYKIKSPKLILRLRYARYIKYIVLVLFVLILPFAVRHELSGLGEFWFCKYICPSGTIFGAIPLLTANDFLRGFIGVRFFLKASIALALTGAEVFVYRFFCRTLCPLGAVYSLFNPIAYFKMHHDKTKCTDCGICAKACAICINPVTRPNSPECVRCGKCIESCRPRALSY
ncbi:MAG: 4Fe-4S binding protein, partial [Synergistaceae bacterium]|nr:4Fe-4S binding protein [Synergistaceae bacterium]